MRIVPNVVVAFFLYSSFAIANDIINKSLTFHHEQYPVSKYSKNVAVINWNSEEGIKRLNNSQYKGHFYKLAHHYQPQQNPASCAIASSVTVLKGIYELNHKSMPIIEEWPIFIGNDVYPLQYRLFNEDNFLNHATDKVLDRRVLNFRLRRTNHNFGGGVDLHEIQAFFKVHGVKSEVVYAKNSTKESVESFRKLLKNVLNSNKQFILLNYDHSYKGLIGGHVSPVVAYDDKTDSVLILDVAAHRNPWIWINLSDLYYAMNTKNYSQKEYRGYILIDTKLK